MKRMLSLLVALALLWGGAALSEDAEPPAALSEGLESASGGMPDVVAELGGALYYTVPSGDALDDQAGPSELWESIGGSAIKLADAASNAVYVEADGAIYYLNRENSRLLMALDPATGEVAQAGDLGFEGARLTATLAGLMVSGLIEAGVYASRLFDRATGALAPSDIDPTAEYHNFGLFETVQTAQGGLKLRAPGSPDWRAVYAGRASAQAEMGGALYYLVPQQYMDSAYVEIYRYDPAAGSRYATQADGHFAGPAVSGGGFLMLAGPSGAVAVDPETGESWPLYQPESELIDPFLLKAGGAVLLYARPDIQSPRQFILSLPPPGEVPGPAPTPEPERDLSRGARGEDVLKLQARLSDLGYAAGKEDGVFGASTYGAVRYFQDALGVRQDGVASVALQHALYGEGAPEFVEFVALSGGSRGIRVEALQSRLRALGYTAAKVDGAYGARTTEAVKLFQREVGLKQTGEASVSVLRRLMAANAPLCSGYITLKKGDSAEAVELLKGRLKVLGYYAGKSSGAFDDRTLAAVRLAQEALGLKADGVATARLQQRLNASGAPMCDRYIELRYGDSGVRVKELQLQLRALGHFGGSIGGNFGQQTQAAVKAFQRDQGLKQTGVAGVGLQELLFSIDEPTPRPTRTPRPTPRPTRTPRPTAKPTPTPKPAGQVISNAALDEMVKLLNGQDPAPRIKYTRKTAVKWLQGKLTDMEYFDPFGDAASGVYDQNTFDAVKKFQKDMRISLSSQNYGYVRQKTFDALVEYGGTWKNPGEPIA